MMPLLLVLSLGLSRSMEKPRPALCTSRLLLAMSSFLSLIVCSDEEATDDNDDEDIWWTLWLVDLSCRLLLLLLFVWVTLLLKLLAIFELLVDNVD